MPEVLTCDLFAVRGRYHSLVGETLGYLLHPVVESGHQGIVDFEGREQ